MTSIIDQAKRSFTYHSLRMYEYTPLESPDTIRLICLHPAESRETPLEGSIVHASRHAELTNSTVYSKYAAVSYTWGTASFSQQLRVQGGIGVGDACVSITPEVEIMLTELRKPHKTRYLWIDAICLNQKDDTEKSQQIPLMGQIYSQARKVIYWLGSNNEVESNTSNVFAYFRHLALLPGGNPISKLFKDQEIASRHVHHFLHRPWFFRRWILQEVVFARHGTLQCGPNTMPWSLFLSACDRIATSSTVVHPEEYSIQMINAVTAKEVDLCTLLWGFHQSACSDKRDRIAALYGFLPRNKQLSLNYSQSYQAIYKQHAVAMLEGPSNYDILVQLLNFGALPGSSDHTFPSWVPDWSNKRRKPVPLFHPDLMPDRKDDDMRSVGVEFRHWKRFMQRNRPLEVEQDTGNQDWKLWKAFAGSISREGRGFGAYLHVRTDELGKDVLNISWLDLWERSATHHEAYGRPIKRVSCSSNSHGSDSIKQMFVPFLDDFQIEHIDLDLIGNAYASMSEDIASLHNLGRLATILEKLMSWKDSKALSPWQGLAARRFVLVCALDMLLNEQVRLTDGLVQLFNHQDRSCGRPLTTSVPSAASLTGIIIELGRILQQADLVVAELYPEEASQHRALKTYIIGPSRLEPEMVLIPLSTREIENSTSPWWRQSAKTTQKQTSWVNEIVVRLLKHRAPGAQGSDLTVLSTDVEKSGSIPPRRATYVGPCLVPIWVDPSRWRSQGNALQPGFNPVPSTRSGKVAPVGFRPVPSKTSGMNFLAEFKNSSARDWLQVGYSVAEQRKEPPPFTIDIV